MLLNESKILIMNYVFVDISQIKKEKAKVREFKKTRAWQQKISAGVCYYCGKKFTAKELTLDHIVPLARGGKTTTGNVVAACLECNKNKGVDTPVDLYFSSK
jgi:5-methylcytosine-specific restriction endonuclease McrA